MISCWDDLPRGAPICFIAFIGVVIILTGFILQRFLPGAVSLALVIMIIVFFVIICLYGVKQGALS